jgi:hypothetical protein
MIHPTGRRFEQDILSVDKRNPLPFVRRKLFDLIFRQDFRAFVPINDDLAWKDISRGKNPSSMDFRMFNGDAGHL